MNHIRTYHYYWHIFFFSLLVCMTEFTKAADRGVLERVIYLAKSKGTVYTLLGKVSEQSGFLFVYDSKVVDNDRTVKLGAGQRTIRQVVYEIIGRQDISLHIVENHILINQLQVQCPVVTTSKDTLAYFTLEGKLQDNQSDTPFCWPSMRHTFSPNFSNTFSSISAAMAHTCVVESALQTTKCEQIAPSNPERSNDTIFLPFYLQSR